MQFMPAKESVPRDLFAGAVVALVVVLDAIAVAAIIIFSGQLADQLTFGITLTLVSCAVVSVVLVLGSSFDLAIVVPSFPGAAVLAPSAVAAMGAVKAGHDPVYTAWAVIACTCITSGLCLILLGRIKLGKFIRFLPYPVIGGFLAGAGWLLVKSSVPIMTGIELELETLHLLRQPSELMKLAPGVTFAVALVLMDDRWHHYLIKKGDKAALGGGGAGRGRGGRDHGGAGCRGCCGAAAVLHVVVPALQLLGQLPVLGLELAVLGHDLGAVLKGQSLDSVARYGISMGAMPSRSAGR